jgi:hypothetical protein
MQGGDITNTGEAPEEWGAFFAAAAPALDGLPLFTAPGNHEYTAASGPGGKPEAYLEAFELPENGPAGQEEEYYSFDCGDVHVISLSANRLDPSESYSEDAEEDARIAAEVDAWIEKDLAGTDRPWKIVLTHQPPYPVEADSTAAGMKERWLPIFARTGVDLILCGHQHEFVRTFPLDAEGDTVSAGEGIVEIMGNASAKSYESGEYADDIAAFEMTGVRGYHVITATADKLAVRAYGADGRELDYWEKDKAA